MSNREFGRFVGQTADKRPRVEIEDSRKHEISAAHHLERRRNKIWHLHLSSKGSQVTIDSNGEVSCPLPNGFPLGNCLITVYDAVVYWATPQVDDDAAEVHIRSNLSLQGADLGSTVQNASAPLSVLCSMHSSDVKLNAGVNSIKKLSMSGVERTFRCLGGLPQVIKFRAGYQLWDSADPENPLAIGPTTGAISIKMMCDFD